MRVKVRGGYWFTLHMKALWWAEKASRPRKLNRQSHRCENLKYRSSIVIDWTCRLHWERTCFYRYRKWVGTVTLHVCSSDMCTYHSLLSLHTLPLAVRLPRFSSSSSLCLIFFFLSNANTCPCGLRGPPSWAWQQCNRLLRLGRP